MIHRCFRCINLTTLYIIRTCHLLKCCPALFRCWLLLSTRLNPRENFLQKRRKQITISNIRIIIYYRTLLLFNGYRTEIIHRRRDPCPAGCDKIFSRYAEENCTPCRRYRLKNNYCRLRPLFAIKRGGDSNRYVPKRTKKLIHDPLWCQGGHV